MPRKKNPNPAPAHRPLIQIDWEYVDKLLEAGCTGIQIAGHYGISDKGFYQRFQQEKGVTFSEYSCSKRSSGDAKLMLKQYEQALGTCVKKINTPILLRLGEERLGQGKKKIATSDLTKEELIGTIRELAGDPRIQDDPRSVLEDKPSLLDQGQSGESHQVQSELGTASIMDERSSLQDHTESPSAGYHDVYLPPLS